MKRVKNKGKSTKREKKKRVSGKVKEEGKNSVGKGKKRISKGHSRENVRRNSKKRGILLIEPKEIRV